MYIIYASNQPTIINRFRTSFIRQVLTPPIELHDRLQTIALTATLIEQA